MPISPTEYISWVQRSLNRILGVGLVTNGAITVDYRDAIEEFQFAYGLARTRDVASQDQNEIIKANHKTPEYVEWVQRALNKVGAGSGKPPNGIFSKDTKDGVLAFQSYMGLVDDGWVGAKTETELIRESGIRPPGEVKIGPPPPKPTPKPAPVRPKTVDPLPIEKRVDRVISTIYWETVHSPSTYPNTTQRKRLHCMLGKMKRSGIDDDYIPHGDARSYVVGTRYPYPKYLPGDLAVSARDKLETNIKRLSVADRTDKESIRKEVLWLYYQVERSLTEINNLYNVHGYEAQAKVIHKWAYDRQNGKTKTTSILACFK